MKLKELVENLNRYLAKNPDANVQIMKKKLGTATDASNVCACFDCTVPNAGEDGVLTSVFICDAPLSEGWEKQETDL